MVTERGRKRLPPYVSYRTFRNFIDRLQQDKPSRIDHSYYGQILSGSSASHLMAALRFLSLIDDRGQPTERLKPLVEAKGEQRPLALRRVASDSFDFVLKGPIEVQNATYGQLEELFTEKFPLQKELCRKCLKFFVELSNDARIALSHNITNHFRSAHSHTVVKGVSKAAGTRTITKASGTGTRRDKAVRHDADQTPGQDSWRSILLAKFPAFDPTWSPEVQVKWFSALEELMKRFIARDDV